MKLKHILKKIKSSDEKEMYELVTNTAVYLCTGGYVNQANTLLSELWKHKLEHDRTTWFADGALNVLWLVSGKIPNDIPFKLYTLNEMEILQREYVAKDKWVYPMELNNLKDTTGTDLVRRGFVKASLQNGNQLPESEVELESLLYLEKYIQESQRIADDVFALAAELSAKNNLIDKTITFLKKWALQDMIKWPSMICRNVHVVPLLLHHVIANELGLTEETAIKWTESIPNEVDQRLLAGKSLAYGKLSWKQLINKLEKFNDKLTSNEALDKITYPKASSNAIRIAEERLGLTLPEDYKSFLAFSNGLKIVSEIYPALYPVEEVDYFKKKEPSLFSLFADYEIFDSGIDHGNFMERCILLSDSNSEEAVWLIPPGNGQTSWETWYVAHWIPGEERYPSFRHYIENILLTMEEMK